MNSDGFDRKWFHDRYGKKIDKTYDAAVFGRIPTYAQIAGYVRRQQVLRGVELYKPRSKQSKGTSAREAAIMAINDPQFKDVEGAYAICEREALARAILREYKSPRDDSAT